eukprot:1152265-Pelagomonas_calceolata.AAC.4
MLLSSSSLLLPSAWAHGYRVQSTKAAPTVQLHHHYHHCQSSPVVVCHASSEGGSQQPLPEGLPDPEFQLKRDPKKRRRGRSAHLRSPGSHWLEVLHLKAERFTCTHASDSNRED